MSLPRPSNLAVVILGDRKNLCNVLLLGRSRKDPTLNEQSLQIRVSKVFEKQMTCYSTNLGR
jgi:hypothetical protein